MDSRNYIAPSLDSLVETIPKFTSTNNLRNKHIQIIKTLLPISPLYSSKQQEILLGACVYLFEVLNSQWTLTAEDKALLEQLKSTLNINEKYPQNVLNERHKFIFLTQFYSYAKENIPADLRAEAISIINAAKVKLTAEWQVVFKRLPTPTALTEGIKQLKADYEEKCSQDSLISKGLAYFGIGGHSKSRLTDIALLETINTSYDYQLCYGNVIYTQLKIATEYLILSPERSKLYQGLKRLSNIDCLTEIDNKDLKNDLVKLMAHISAVAASYKQSQQWAEMGLNAEKVQDQLTDILAELKNSKAAFTDSTRLNYLINNLCNYISNTVAQAGIATALAEVVSLLVSNGLSVHSLLQLLDPRYAALAFAAFMIAPVVQKLAGSKVVSILAYPIQPLVHTAAKAPIYGYRAVNQFLFSPKVVSLNEEEAGDLARALYLSGDGICTGEEKDRLELSFERAVLKSGASSVVSEKCFRCN